jgi:hypothetical protein
MKETCFAYQNKKTLSWLKINRCLKVYREGYGYGYSVYDSFDECVMYCNRGTIEEDFSKTKVENSKDWQLMEVEIEYSFTAAV